MVDVVQKLVGGIREGRWSGSSVFERIRLLGSQCDEYRTLRVKTYFTITVRGEGRKRLLRFAVLVLFLPKLWIRAWAFSPARFC